MAASKLRYPLAKPRLGHAERRLLLEAFDSGRISSNGEFVKRFERAFSGYIGTRFGVSCCNGTAALHLALLALEVGRGDEVIVSDLSFVAPANMVAYSGGKVVLADSNPSYWGVDAETVRSKITPKTRAVILVHLYGHPVDIDPILEICAAKDIPVIEDCAEAHGALYKGRKIGSLGRINCFSFYGNKILTTGEGGMCLTDSQELAERMRILRDHGADRTRHFWHPVLGFNYRMTNLQAAIGCAQLQTIESRIVQYRRIGHAYTKRLASLKVTTHPEMDWAKCVFWMYTILVGGLTYDKKEKLQLTLMKRGIETRPMFYPISRLPPYRGSQPANTIASKLSRRGISLPTYVDLTKGDIEEIASTFEEALRQI